MIKCSNNFIDAAQLEMRSHQEIVYSQPRSYIPPYSRNAPHSQTYKSYNTTPITNKHKHQKSRSQAYQSDRYRDRDREKDTSLYDRNRSIKESSYTQHSKASKASAARSGYYRVKNTDDQSGDISVNTGSTRGGRSRRRMRNKNIRNNNNNNSNNNTSGDSLMAASGEQQGHDQSYGSAGGGTASSERSTNNTNTGASIGDSIGNSLKQQSSTRQSDSNTNTNTNVNVATIASGGYGLGSYGLSYNVDTSHGTTVVDISPLRPTTGTLLTNPNRNTDHHHHQQQQHEDQQHSQYDSSQQRSNHAMSDYSQYSERSDRLRGGRGSRGGRGRGGRGGRGGLRGRRRHRGGSRTQYDDGNQHDQSQQEYVQKFSIKKREKPPRIMKREHDGSSG